MRVPAFILSWVKSVTGPLLGWDPRPLPLRDTLPDHSRPTVPPFRAQALDVRPKAVNAGHASHCVK